jgi:hypothetical protein
MRCARAVRGKMHTPGLQVRPGLHTGECELIGGDIGGIAVHIAAGVAASAGSRGVDSTTNASATRGRQVFVKCEMANTSLPNERLTLEPIDVGSWSRQEPTSSTERGARPCPSLGK